MAHSEEWAIGYVWGWKKAERPEKAETVEKVESQWSTLESGPLARLESMEKGLSPYNCVKRKSQVISGTM